MDEGRIINLFSRRAYNFKVKSTRMTDSPVDYIHRLALKKMSNNTKLLRHGTETFSDSRKVHFFETKDFKREEFL